MGVFGVCVAHNTHVHARTRVHACCTRVALHAWLEHLLVAEDLDSAAARRQKELLAAEVPRL